MLRTPASNDTNLPTRRRRLLQLLDSGFRVELNGEELALDANNELSFAWLEGVNTLRLMAGADCPVYVITCDEPEQGGSESSSTGEPEPEPVDSSSTGEPEPVPAESSSTGEEEPPAESSTGPVDTDDQCLATSVTLGNGIVFFPPFTPAELEYYCSCANDVFLGSVTATTFNESASITLNVNGEESTLRSGMEGGSFEMQYGTNNLSLTVSHGCETVYTFECLRLGSAEEQNQTLYGWFQSAFGDCSAECTSTTGVAVGNFSREVYCRDSDGARVDDQFCSTAARPLDWRSCTVPCSTQQLDTDPDTDLDIDVDTDPDGDGDPHDGDGIDIDVNAASVKSASLSLLLALVAAAMLAF